MQPGCCGSARVRTSRPLGVHRWPLVTADPGGFSDCGDRVDVGGEGSPRLRGEDCAAGPEKRMIMRSEFNEVVVAKYSFNTVMATNYMWATRKHGPHPDSILYRSTKALDNAESFETHIPVSSLSAEALSGGLPRSCDIKTTYFYDPVKSSEFMKGKPLNHVAFQDVYDARALYYEEDDDEIILIPLVGQGMKVTNSKANDHGDKSKVREFHPSRTSIAVSEAKALRNAWDLSLFLGLGKPCDGWPVVKTPKATYHFGPRSDGQLHIDAERDALPKKYANDSGDESDFDCGEGRCLINDQELVGNNMMRKVFIPAVGAPHIHMMWILDTGCGHHLVSARNVDQYRRKFKKSRSELVLNTAGGSRKVEW